jgi:hypothetical protein
VVLGKHSRTQRGRYREERSDSQAGNLAKDYPEFKKLPPKTTYGAIKKRLGTSSMDETRRALRREQQG